MSNRRPIWPVVFVAAGLLLSVLWTAGLAYAVGRLVLAPIVDLF